MRFTSLGYLITFGVCLTLISSAEAATLRAIVEVTGPRVYLSDLFAGLDVGQDCVLGDAPAPGSRLVIQQPQLEAIASQFGVSWEPLAGGETVVLDREGRNIERATVVSMLGDTLSKRFGVRDDIVLLTSYQDTIVDRAAHISVGDISLDQTGERFEATLIASVDGRDSLRMPLSGTIDRLLQLTVPSRSIAEGDIITEKDLITVQIPASHVHSEVLSSQRDGVGQVATRSLPPGLPIPRAYLRRPNLIARGSPIMMRLVTAGIEVEAQGLALESGTIDDQVRVLNPVSRAVLLATVTGTNEVRINPTTPAFVRAGIDGLASASNDSYAQTSYMHFGDRSSLSRGEP